MDALIERLAERPIFFAIALLLVGAVAYTVVKKLLKLALILALGFAALVGYYAYTGKEPPQAVKDLKEKAERHIERGVRKAREKVDEAADRVGEEVRKAASEAIEGVGEDDS